MLELALVSVPTAIISQVAGAHIGSQFVLGYRRIKLRHNRLCNDGLVRFLHMKCTCTSRARARADTTNFKQA